MVENTPPEVVDLAISCFVNVAKGIAAARHGKVDHLCPLTPALSRKGRGSIGIFIRCSNAPGAVPLLLEGLYELRKLERAHIDNQQAAAERRDQGEVVLDQGNVARAAAFFEGRILGIRAFFEVNRVEGR